MAADTKELIEERNQSENATPDLQDNPSKLSADASRVS